MAADCDEIDRCAGRLDHLRPDGIIGWSWAALGHAGSRHAEHAREAVVLHVSDLDYGRDCAAEDLHRSEPPSPQHQQVVQDLVVGDSGYVHGPCPPG